MLTNIVFHIAIYFAICFVTMKLRGLKSLSGEAMFWIGFLYLIFIGSIK